MAGPSWDARLAMSALCRLPERERIAVLTQVSGTCSDLGALVALRNALTVQIDELISQRFGEETA